MIYLYREMKGAEMFKIASKVNKDGLFDSSISIELTDVSFEKLMEIQNTLYQMLDINVVSLKQDVLNIYRKDNYAYKQDNNKIGLIKAYRQKTGAGLFDAKAWVDENFPDNG